MLAFLALACAPDAIGLTDERDTRGLGGDSGGTADDSGETGGSAADTSGDTGDTHDTGPATVASWTILVYLNGDNDLEEYAAVDLEELEQVGSTEDVHVVVQFDRSDSFWRGDGDWSGARRYHVEQAPDRGIGSPVLEELGAVDSADPTVLADFADWALARWPAERVAFVLWDHGDYWTFAPPETPPETKSISADYGSGNDLSVANGELDTLLARVSASAGGAIDLVGMDACSMQTWEVATVAAPYASVFVASQDYEDVTGWAYDTTLADLVADPGMDAAALGEHVAARFHEIPDSTQSVIDLAALPAVTAALDALATAGMATAPDLVGAAGDAQGFDGSSSTNHDLVDLTRAMAAATDDETVLAALADVEAATLAAVLASYTDGGDVADAHGLTIYSPANGRVPGSYADAAWSLDTRWDEFLEAGRGN